MKYILIAIAALMTGCANQPVDYGQDRIDWLASMYMNDVYDMSTAHTNESGEVFYHFRSELPEECVRHYVDKHQPDWSRVIVGVRYGCMEPPDSVTSSGSGLDTYNSVMQNIRTPDTITVRIIQ